MPKLSDRSDSSNFLFLKLTCSEIEWIIDAHFWFICKFRCKWGTIGFPSIGGVAVIKVGGATEVEVKERKDRVEDALNATRAAVEEGIVVGGGCALLYASQGLSTLKVKGDDQKSGVALVAKALQAPVRQITLNAGVDGSVVVQMNHSHHFQRM